MVDLNTMIDELDRLTVEELRRLRDTVDERLSWEQMNEQQREDAFERMLLERGVISSIPDRSTATPTDQRPVPIAIEGEPLSETIIRERR